MARAFFVLSKNTGEFGRYSVRPQCKKRSHRLPPLWFAELPITSLCMVVYPAGDEHCGWIATRMTGFGQLMRRTRPSAAGLLLTDKNVSRLSTLSGPNKFSEADASAVVLEPPFVNQ